MCSRVMWTDNGQAIVVGRNPDWPEEVQTDLWAFPRGIAHVAAISSAMSPPPSSSALRSPSA